MRRLLLATLAVLAASALSGCERLCAPNAAGKAVGVFCPESSDNPLNDRPGAEFALSYPRAGEGAEPERLPRPDTVETGRDVIVRSTSRDPNGDDLFLEWDLDGDGRFERSGYESAVGSVDTRFHAAGSRRIKLRVTDFPTQLGAPGESTRTREVHAIDRAANRPPRALLSVSPNPAVAGEEIVFDATASSDPDFHDAGQLRYDWDFGFFRGFDEIVGFGFGASGRGRYLTAGSKDVEVTVRDFFGAEHVAKADVRVVTGHPGNRPPTARAVAIPNPAEAGEPITWDASASSDPDGDVLEFCWDFDEDGTTYQCTNDDPTERTNGYFTPGEHRADLRVTDSSGAEDTAPIVVRVLPASEENLPPTARFTPTPISPEVSAPVTLDASASSDPEGPIARFEWDLDGNGSFETDNGDDPAITTSYETPGERFVRLRVTDAGGATGTTGRTIVVRPPPAAFALADPFPAALVAQSRRTRAIALPFSARLRGTPLPGARGQRRRRGPRLSLLGVLGRGDVRARLVNPPGRGSRAERRLRRFLRAPWRTRVSLGYDRRAGRWTARAIALARARRDRGAAACLRLRLVGRRGRHPTGRLTVLGGRGSGARLRGGASFRFSLNRNGSATALGRIRARTGPKRPLPRSCRRLTTRSVR